MQEVIDSFDITDTEIKLIKKEIFNAIDDLKKYEKKSIAELKQEYDKLTDLVAEQLIESITSRLVRKLLQMRLRTLQKVQKIQLSV